MGFHIDHLLTENLFYSTIPQNYYDYLTTRGVISQQYINALQQKQFGILCENTIQIDDTYSVRYILGASNESIYDLIQTNKLYLMPKEIGTVFAVLEGDDFLFFKPFRPEVFFFYRDTEEEIMLSSDFYNFVNKIKYI